MRLPERFSYKHCNWLYLSSISDEHLLEATIRDAVEHRTNVFNIPGPTVSVNCDGTVAGGDAAAADRLIPRLPGGVLSDRWLGGARSGRRAARLTRPRRMRAYSQALHWYADHMRELGLSDADYALYLQDEPGLNGGRPRASIATWNR